MIVAPIALPTNVPDDSRQSQFPGLCDLQIGNDDGRDQRIKGMLQMEKLRSSESRYGRDCSPAR